MPGPLHETNANAQRDAHGDASTTPNLSASDLWGIYPHMANRCYCIALRRAERRVTAIYDEALQPVGVNVAQFSLLTTISKAAPASLSEVARLTELDRSTVGRNVKVLQRMELVTSIAGEDQREAAVVLTARGRGVLADGAKYWDIAQAKIESALGAPVARHLRTLLQTV